MWQLEDMHTPKHEQTPNAVATAVARDNTEEQLQDVQGPQGILNLARKASIATPSSTQVSGITTDKAKASPQRKPNWGVSCC
jgi:hypothetical protein